MGYYSSTLLYFEFINVGDIMKDYLCRYTKWCDELIEFYKKYFNSRVDKYHVTNIGVECSFKLLLKKHDVNSTDIVYFSCYNECVGKLELIGSLINKVGE